MEREGELSTDFGASADDKSIEITDSSSEVINGIVTKSFRIQGGTLGGYRAFEIPFIDGREEFLGRAAIQDEEVSQFTSGADSIGSFRLTHWQNLVPSAELISSDPPPGVYFKEAKSNHASLGSQGDYYFDTTGAHGDGVGYVYVHMGGVGVSMPTGYTVSYQYYDEFSRERMKGSYSVDSVNGVVYFAEPLTSTDVTKSVSFKYTPYKVKYNISLQLEEGRDYTVNAEARTISILPGAVGSSEKFLTINYKYLPETLRTLDLAPYFSPLVRAINIRVS
jgi:hypothetical protein